MFYRVSVRNYDFVKSIFNVRTLIKLLKSVLILSGDENLYSGSMFDGNYRKFVLKVFLRV